MNKDIESLLDLNLFTDIDRHFADFMTTLSGAKSTVLYITSLLVSNSTGKGDICLDISEIAGKNISYAFDDHEEIKSKIIFPEKNNWINELQKLSVVGKPEEFKPLILDEKQRIYLYRYWEYERLLADNIKSRLNILLEKIDFKLLKEDLDRYFPVANLNNDHSVSGGTELTETSTDWQKIAAFASVTKKFCIISGGPGTGKTSTIFKILLLFLEQTLTQSEKNECMPTIALAAPTGKAAARLKESIKKACDNYGKSSSIKQFIPDEAFTIHRLLGTIPGSPYFRYNAENQLPYDIVIVDESSMIDLALMTKLLLAVPLTSHLILLGDKHQLASVEAGSVFGDICDTGKEHLWSKNFISKLHNVGCDVNLSEFVKYDESPISDSIVMLTKSYRFSKDSGIGSLSRAVRDGKDNDAVLLLKDKKFDDIQLTEIQQYQDIYTLLNERLIKDFYNYLNADTPDEALKLFTNSAILCVLRRGPYGVENLNNIIERILKDYGLIDPTKKWYKGRPILVNQNNYNLKLFNGDIGIIFPDNSNENNIRFFFSSPDGAIKRILPLRLPQHETAYAMTVHKSQGAEFDNVILILPNQPNRALTRELLYTAITRARKKVEVLGTEHVLRLMIKNPTRRQSGLRDYLWG